MRHDRAYRAGAELFVYERAFADILDRLTLIRRHFERALLIGCPDPEWKQRLEGAADRIDAVDPGPLFAEAAGGACVVEDAMDQPTAAYDLCVAVGTLDSVNDLPAALRTIRAALKPDSLFIGALSGGDTLPQLRSAMRAADQETGTATPHVHPRIEASALAGLLAASGFAMPVVDVERVQVAYSSLWDLVRDLRAMGATNVLQARSARPLSRRAAAAAAEQFAAAGIGGKTVERFELLHFAAWTAAADRISQG
jgi:SAM-dependent methyltransferase